MIIDSHVHFWRLARGDYDWLTPDLATLYRDFEPADLAPVLEAAGVAGVIAVQAAATEAETGFLLELARLNPLILGVVGWTDFTSPRAPEAIARLARQARLKGLRPMLQDLGDDDFILRPAADAALAAMASHGLRLDALVRPRHLPRLITVRERHPDLAMVVDHAAKPDIAAGAWEPWASDMRRLGGDGRTCCKLSGLITEAGTDWTADSLRPYVDLILDAFGSDRVMWGGDWPVLTMAGTYDRWMTATRDLLGERSASERSVILSGAARRFYGLE